MKASEKFSFKIPPQLPTAQIGKVYRSDVSFCTPFPPAKRLCGVFAKITNPAGGKEPYTFRLKIGSNLLPTGMTLNANTGVISGKPKAGQKPVTKNLIVCAYDANDRFSGVCRSTTMALKK